MFRKFLPKFLPLLLIGVFMTNASIAYAGLGLGPTSGAYFIYEVDPGDVIVDTFQLKNTGDEIATFELFPIDAFLTDDGTFALGNEEDEQMTIGAWVEMDDADENGLTIYTVDPGEIVTGTFTLTIPKSLAPGDYVGAISAKGYTDPNAGAGGSVASIAQVGVRTYITVSGEGIMDFQWNSFGQEVLEDGSRQLNLGIKNEGNMMVTGNVAVTATNFFFLKDKFEVPLGNVLPGTDSLITMKWEDAPRAGLVRVKGTMTYQKGSMSGPIAEGDETYAGEVTKGTWVVILPLIETIISLVVFLIVFFILFKRHRKYKQAIKTYTSTTSKKDEPVTVVAARYNVNWKFFAKVNNVKSPYFVTKGQKLLVPKKGK
jgi:hypothetical protein